MSAPTTTSTEPDRPHELRQLYADGGRCVTCFEPANNPLHSTGGQD